MDPLEKNTRFIVPHFQDRMIQRFFKENERNITTNKNGVSSPVTLSRNHLTVALNEAAGSKQP